MIEHEHNVLGLLMCDNSRVGQYPFDLHDFSDHRNREIYTAIKSLVDAGDPADPTTVSERTGIDVAFLSDLCVNTTGFRNIAAYHADLQKQGALRRARSYAADLSKAKTLEDIERVATGLMEIGHVSETHEAEQSAVLARTVNHLEQIESGEHRGLPTGLKRLDDLLGGFHGGDLVVIAARSQHGKTALMMNMANALDVPAGVISGEQPAEQLAMRSISIVGGVSLQKQRTGTMTNEDWDRVGAAINTLHGKRLAFFDKGGPSISEITAVAHQWAYNKKVQIIFVDYLQLVTGGGGEQHRLQVGDIARKLKVLAKQLNIPIVALAQVRRAVDDRDAGPDFLGRMPWTSDLADSAQIEDAADQIITLYRPEVYFRRPDVEGLAYLNVCKNRHGETGTVRCRWAGEYIRFMDDAPSLAYG